MPAVVRCLYVARSVASVCCTMCSPACGVYVCVHVADLSVGRMRVCPLLLLHPFPPPPLPSRTTTTTTSQGAHQPGAARTVHSGRGRQPVHDALQAQDLLAGRTHHQGACMLSRDAVGGSKHPPHPHCFPPSPNTPLVGHSSPEETRQLLRGRQHICQQRTASPSWRGRAQSCCRLFLSVVSLSLSPYPAHSQLVLIDSFFWGPLQQLHSSP